MVGPNDHNEGDLSTTGRTPEEWRQSAGLGFLSTACPRVVRGVIRL